MSTTGALRLEVVSGKAAGFSLTVDDRLVIGRQSEGPGKLADDPELSRHHAKISRQDEGTYMIEDLASTNGTLLNGERIEGPRLLTTEDSIEVGGTTIIVAEAPTQSAEAAAVDPRAATVTVETPQAMRDLPPAPPAAVEPSSAEAPRLSLRLVVDPEQGEAEIHLDDESEPIRLSFSDGRWQPLGGDS